MAQRQINSTSRLQHNGSGLCDRGKPGQHWRTFWVISFLTQMMAQPGLLCEEDMHHIYFP